MLIIALACYNGTIVTLSVIKCTANCLVITEHYSELSAVSIKHHLQQHLLCTDSLQVTICVANIAICFLGHPVEMLDVPAAALYFSCSTRCTVPRKHQLQSPHGLGGGVI